VLIPGPAGQPDEENAKKTEEVGRERTVDQFNLFEGAGRLLLGCLAVSTADRASSFLRARSDFELNWPTGALRPKQRRLVRRRRWSRPDVLELSMTG
jgi:hypothetical protein